MLRKLRRRILVAGIAFSAAAAPVVAPLAAQPAVVMAAETQALDNAIADAENTPHLDVNVTTETITVKKSQEAAKRAQVEGWEQEEVQKIRNAIAEQEENNSTYESQSNDPDYLINKKPKDFSKNAIYNFFKEDGGLNVADVNVMVNNSKTKPKAVGFGEINEADTATHDMQYYTESREAVVGAYGYYTKFIKDKATGKDVDMKITVVEIPDDGKSRAVAFGINSLTIKTNAAGKQNPIKFKVEFFESGTNKPIAIDTAWMINDIDNPEVFARNSGTYLLADAIDKPVTLSNGTVMSNTDVAVTNKTFYDETWMTAEATIVDADGLDNDNNGKPNESRNYEKYLTLERGADSFEFLWGGYGLTFKQLGLGLNEPELVETSVDVTQYKIVVEPDDENATFNFIDTNDNTVAESISKTGKDNETIPVTDVNGVISNLHDNGYDIVTNPTKNNLKYDEDPEVNQEFTVVVTPHIETIEPDNPKEPGTPTDRAEVSYPEGVDEADLNKTYTRTIYYKYNNKNGEDVKQPVTQTVKLTRTATFNYVTKEVTYSDWTTGTFNKENSPVIDNYTYDKSSIPSKAATEDMTEYVIYKKIPQKGSVTFTDGENDLADKVTLDGFNEEPIDYSPQATIDEIENKGWDVESNDFPENPVYDTDSEVDQDYTVAFKPHIETITSEDPKDPDSPTDRTEVTYPGGLTKEDLSKTVTRVITYVDENGNEMAKPVTQTVTVTRTATFNYVTKEVTYSDWTTDSLAEVISPDIAGYTRDKDVISSADITVDSQDIEEVVTYKKIIQEASITYRTDEEVLELEKMTGGNNEPIEYTPGKIEEYESEGYDFISSDIPDNPVFDEDTEVGQDFTVLFEPHIEKITPGTAKEAGTPTDRSKVEYPEGVSRKDLTKTITRTIIYLDTESNQMAEPVTQTVTLGRTATFNYVTKDVEYSAWTTKGMDEVVSPDIEDYTRDKDSIAAIEVTAEMSDMEEIVTYGKIGQKAVVTYKSGEEELDKDELNGFNKEPIDYNPEEKIEGFKNKGYDLVDNDFPEDAAYDTDPEVDQQFTINLTPHIETITPDNPKKEGDSTDRTDVTYPGGVDEKDLKKTVKRTIKFIYEDGSEAKEPVEQEVTLTRTATFNYVTKEVTYSDWTTAVIDGVEVPEIDGYTADKTEIASVDVTTETEDMEEVVTYKKNPEAELPAEIPQTPSETPAETPVTTGSSVSIPPATSTSPSTGDASSIGLFAGLAAAAAGTGAFVGFRRRRKDKE